MTNKIKDTKIPTGGELNREFTEFRRGLREEISSFKGPTHYGEPVKKRRGLKRWAKINWRILKNLFD